MDLENPFENTLRVDEKNNSEPSHDDNNGVEDIENNQNVMNILSPTLEVCQRKHEDSGEEVMLLTTHQNELECENQLTSTKPNDEKDIFREIIEKNSDSEVEDTPITAPNERGNRHKMLDSDSENEQGIVKICENSKSNTNLYELDSDSENENTSKKISLNRKHKRIAIIDSDSDDETSVVGRKQIEDLNEQSEIFVVDNKGKLIQENEINSNDHQRKILSNLCDSDSGDDNSKGNSSDDEGGEQISGDELSYLQSNVIIPSKSSRKTANKKHVQPKVKKMTYKKALEDRKEILAESQRRMRESRVSLPYHKPKPRSLKEFLQNRPKLTSHLANVSQGVSPSAAIKMSMEQLKVISQKLKEREKEIEQFYKSESESDSEQTSNKVEDPIQQTESSDTFPSQDIQVEIKDQNDDNILKNYLVDQTKVIDINEVKCCENMDIQEASDELESENIDKSTEQPEVNEENILDRVDANISKETSVSTEEPKIIKNAENNEANLDLMDTTQCQETVQSVSSLQKDEFEETNKEYSEIPINQDEMKDEGMKVVNIAGTMLQDKELTNSTEENLTEPVKPDKIVILSNVTLTSPETESKKALYNLDDEFLDLEKEILNEMEHEFDSYVFNLDDIEDESECIVGGKNQQKEDMDEEKQYSKLRKNKLSEKLSACRPRLSGGPNEVIDLETSVVMPDEIFKLRERFFKHNSKIGRHKQKKEISVLSVSHGEIRKETLPFNIDEDDEESKAPIEKPGVRLKKLREELEHQMAQKRSELWKEKHIKPTKIEDESEEKNNEETLDSDMDILDDDEEEELTESEEDEELEENDCDMSEKKKKKSDFLQEEAEESEIEENEDDEVVIEDNDGDDELEDTNRDDITEDEDKEEDIEEEEEEEPEQLQKPKVLKRIIKPMDDEDSDDGTNYKNRLFGLNFGEKKTLVNYSEEDFLIPPNRLPANFKTTDSVLTPTNSQKEFPTPVTQITGLQKLNTSESRVLDVISHDDESPSSKKQLFMEEVGQESQTTDDRFPNTPKTFDNSIADITNDFPKPISSQEDICTQDVLAICSGEFPTSLKSSPEISTQHLKEPSSDAHNTSSGFDTQDLAEICSGKFPGFSPDKSNKETETALDEKEENLISQLIDEEELEKFKQRFEYSLASNTQKSMDFEHAEEVQGTGGVIGSDDDDDEELHVKKKQRKILTFSDDEDSTSYESDHEEAINLHDEELDCDVEYDSEENEIEREEVEADPNKIMRNMVKASEFFENEAELSESEWGSEDEDEKNLDDMEFEKGDEEKFDQDQMRSDIEKLHMRQLLDEDNREVKLLQELLLEDGELHGSGRQRQFRWKNIDAAGNEFEEKKEDDGDTFLENEEETEEEWRKMRHKREMFMLKKQSQKEDGESLLIESQRLSFTKKTLKIKNQYSISAQTLLGETVGSPKVKQSFSLLNKRGSLLSRGEQVLQKLAGTNTISMGSKNSNRIVFQAVNQEEKKRKAVSSVTPAALKKIRLSELSPALNKQKPKVGRSLFG